MNCSHTCTGVYLTPYTGPELDCAIHPFSIACFTCCSISAVSLVDYRNSGRLKGVDHGVIGTLHSRIWSPEVEARISDEAEAAKHIPIVSEEL